MTPVLVQDQPLPPSTGTAISSRGIALFLEMPIQLLRRFALTRTQLAGLVLSVLLLSVWGVRDYWNRRLITPASPSGLASLALAGDVLPAAAVLDSWGDANKAIAAFCIGIDFLFIAVYVSLVALLCAWSSAAARSRAWRAAGMVLAWSQLLAGVLNVCQDMAVLSMLFGGAAPTWPRLSALCAIARFVLVSAGMIYSGLTVLAVVSRGWSPRLVLGTSRGARP